MSDNGSKTRPVQNLSEFIPSRQLVVEDLEFEAVREGRTRIIIGVLVFLGVFLLILGRLAEVAVLHEKPGGISYAQAEVKTRADILDRNGALLATTLQTFSLYADTRLVGNPEETAELLGLVLPDLDYDTVLKRLTSGKEFIWISRNLTPKERQAVFELGQPGLAFEVEPRRVYPAGRVAAHVLGWTDVDMVGAAGAERAFDVQLMAEPDKPKKLSIDLRFQNILTEELHWGMKRFEADGAAGVILDVKTGELLALASLPDFDPNNYAAALPQTRFNRATMGTYELGSTFKPLTMALALESGIDPERPMPVQDPLIIRRKSIRDDHKSNDPIKMFDVLADSSNRGTAMYALEVGDIAQQDFLRKFGLFDRVPFELAESAAPQLPPEWQDLTVATVSYGHGIAVSPLALATALSALINGGDYVTPTLEYRSVGQAQPRRRVIKQGTSDMMRDMMRYVMTDGTGRNAEVPGFGFMGKTGTAEKPGRGGYQERNLVTSFVLAFPHSDPKYLIFVTYDEPKAAPGTYGYATAGWNAAPTAGQVAERMVTLLGMPPERKNASLPMTPTGGQ